MNIKRILCFPVEHLIIFSVFNITDCFLVDGVMKVCPYGKLPTLHLRESEECLRLLIKMLQKILKEECVRFFCVCVARNDRPLPFEEGKLLYYSEMMITIQLSSFFFIF